MTQTHAFFDMTGTLVLHDVLPEPVPGMETLIARLRDERGWTADVLSRYPSCASENILRDAGFPWRGGFHFAEDKGAFLAEWLREHPEVERVFFVDDRPENLETAATVTDPRLLSVGFLGSGKYEDALPECCKRLGVPLARCVEELREVLEDARAGT